MLGTTNGPVIYDNATNGFNYRDRYIDAFGLPNMGNGGFNGRFGPQWSNAGVAPGPSGFQELDTNVVATVIRKGNFNYATTNVLPSESLRGEALPGSLYLTRKPDWWGPRRWPAFGPDLNPFPQLNSAGPRGNARGRLDGVSCVGGIERSLHIGL